MNIRFISAPIIGLSIIFGLGLRADPIIDSINPTLNPAGPSGLPWSAREVAFQYIPSISYNLSGVSTNFGSQVTSQTVTLEIYDSTPGGIVLGATTFTASGGWVGGTFDPIALTAGSVYYIGFLNVSGLSTNFTDESGFVVTPYYWGDDWQSYPFYYSGHGALLQFEGSTTSVPDGGFTVTMLGGALVVLVALRRRCVK